MPILQLAEAHHGPLEVDKPGVLSGFISKIVNAISSTTPNSVIDASSPTAPNSVIDESESIKNNHVMNPNFIGPFICRVGQYKCWEAKGEVTETFSLLSQEIKVYLETHSEPVPKPVIWSLYIVGRTVRTAVPTIMFCCPWKLYRKRIRKEVDDSSILSRYPGFTTGDCKSPLGTSKPVPLGKKDDYGAKLQVSTCITSSNPPGPTGGRLDIHFSSTSDGTIHKVREATAGFVLRLDHDTYVLTAGHAFLESSDLDQFGLGDLEDDEFDIGDEAFDVGDDDVRTTAYGSEGEEEDEDPDHQGARQHIGDTIPASFDRFDINAPPLVASRLAGPLLPSHNDSQPRLDYALLACGKSGQNHFTCVKIPIPSGYYNLFPEAVVGPGFRSSSVLAVTSSGELLVGTINETPSFLTSTGRPTCQELWTVRFCKGGPLRKGDCGSIVIDKKTSQIYGYIICGDPEHGFAYVVPACHVLMDLSRHFGQNVELATRSNTQHRVLMATGSEVTPSALEEAPPSDDGLLSQSGREFEAPFPVFSELTDENFIRDIQIICKSDDGEHTRHYKMMIDRGNEHENLITRRVVEENRILCSHEKPSAWKQVLSVLAPWTEAAKAVNGQDSTVEMSWVVKNQEKIRDQIVFFNPAQRYTTTHIVTNAPKNGYDIILSWKEVERLNVRKQHVAPIHQPPTPRYIPENKHNSDCMKRTKEQHIKEQRRIQQRMGEEKRKARSRAGE